MPQYDKYSKALLEAARKSGHDQSQALSLFLDYLLDVFDSENYLRHQGDVYRLFLDAKEQNAYLFNLLLDWTKEVTEAMRNHQTIDFFGQIYEELFKGKGKASALGQFFTPSSVCRLMSRCVVPESRGRQTFDDCACGSGRTLLAAFEQADWHKANFFHAADIDTVSCKMCALNFMIHGMLGTVEQRDTLMMTTPSVVYCINEIRYPIPCQFYSIRKIYPK